MQIFISRYFEGGVSSVYLWDLDHGFAGAILIKKAGDNSKKIKGCWDSLHIIEVQVGINDIRARTYYKILFIYQA